MTSLEHLELAARSGLLARVPGIGPLTVERVLRDLDGRKQAPLSRVLLSEALALSDALVAWMLDDPHTIKAEQTGSARRRGRGKPNRNRSHVHPCWRRGIQCAWDHLTLM